MPRKRYTVSIIRKNEEGHWTTFWTGQAHTKLGAYLSCRSVWKIIDDKRSTLPQLWDHKNPEAGVFVDSSLRWFVLP